jgi:hypothetical protein
VRPGLVWHVGVSDKPTASWALSGCPTSAPGQGGQRSSQQPFEGPFASVPGRDCPPRSDVGQEPPHAGQAHHSTGNLAAALGAASDWANSGTRNVSGAEGSWSNVIGSARGPQQRAKDAVRCLTVQGKKALVAGAMVSSLIVALGSELAFIIGLFIGSIVSALVSVAITAVRGCGQFSTLRALVQGWVCGLFAGTACGWVAVKLGRSLSVPEGRLIWLAIVPPILGEFGHFLNRFSLRYGGKPDTGVFVPLGRLHRAAWAPIRRGIFTIALEVLKGSGAEDTPALAVRKADSFIGWMCCGVAGGAAISIWWLAKVLHVFN